MRQTTRTATASCAVPGGKRLLPTAASGQPRRLKRIKAPASAGADSKSQIRDATLRDDAAESASAAPLVAQALVDAVAAKAATDATDAGPWNVQHSRPSKQWWVSHRSLKLPHRQYAGTHEDAVLHAAKVKAGLLADTDSWSDAPFDANLVDSLISDGRASAAARFKLQHGCTPVRQFCPGTLGSNTAYSRSSNREAIALASNAPVAHGNLPRTPYPLPTYVTFALAPHAQSATFLERLAPEQDPVPAWVTQVAESRHVMLDLWS